MISSGDLLGYTVASFVLIVVPGPGVLFNLCGLRER